jgi:hypothetical protein
MEPKELWRLQVCVALRSLPSLLSASRQPEAAVEAVLQVVVEVEQGALQCLRCLEHRMEE